MSLQHVSLEMDNNTGEQKGHQNNIIPSEVETVDGRIPRAVPEVDDDDDDDRPISTDHRTGVDDGFLQPANNNPQPRRPSFSFPSNDGNGFIEINGVLTPVPDVNAYQHKKTLAQGMMDLALLSANANQLRYVLETSTRHPYYYPSLIFISLSIILQVAVGAGLIMNGRYNIKNKKEICRANKVNNYTVIGIFIVTVVNVLISAFGVADPVQNA